MFAIALLVRAILLCLGVGLLTIARREFAIARSAERWPSVCGSVLVSKVAITSKYGGGKSYNAEIEYAFTLDGECYKGTNYSYVGAVRTSKSRAEKQASRYAKGSKLRVYYNPNEPEKSVVVPGVHWEQSALVVAFLLILLAIGFMPELGCFGWPQSNVCEVALFEFHWQ